MTRALFTGDRNWSNQYVTDLILHGLEGLLTFGSEEFVVIEGEARGLDQMVRMLCEVRHPRADVLKFPAHWRHSNECPKDCGRPIGRPAGVIRNQQMLDEGKPQMVFAFHDDLPHSRGTLDMCERALKAKLPVVHVRMLDLDTVAMLRRYQRRNASGSGVRGGLRGSQ